MVPSTGMTRGPERLAIIPTSHSPARSAAAAPGLTRVTRRTPLSSSSSRPAGLAAQVVAMPRAWVSSKASSSSRRLHGSTPRLRTARRIRSPSRLWPPTYVPHAVSPSSRPSGSSETVRVEPRRGARRPSPKASKPCDDPGALRGRERRRSRGRRSRGRGTAGAGAAARHRCARRARGIRPSPKRARSWEPGFGRRLPRPRGRGGARGPRKRGPPRASGPCRPAHGPRDAGLRRDDEGGMGHPGPSLPGRPPSRLRGGG